jgi:hypothetical protein
MYDLFQYAVTISDYTASNGRIIKKKSGKDFQGSYRDLNDVIFQNLPVGTETNHETSSWSPIHLPEFTSDELPLELVYSVKAAKKTAQTGDV